jgi:hypothetical protein
MQLKINDNLYLVRHELSASSYQNPDGIDHIVIIDCSGSMSWDLPKIRQQLKEKLVTMLDVQDTVSIIWFSGSGEYGVLVKAEPVADLRDLSKMHAAIDRWLRPVGLTGFAQPLHEAKLLAGELRQPGRLINLFFMSDGHDNQSSRGDILMQARGLSNRIDGSTVVEYGHYADRQLLSEMAQLMGGEMIFSDGFAQYEATFAKAVENPGVGHMELYFLPGREYIDNLAFAFYPAEQRLLTYEVDPIIGSVTVPGHTAELWTLATESNGLSVYTNSTIVTDAALYAAMAVFATRRRTDIIYSILKVLGDVRLIKQFTNCFTKQEYSDFQAAAAAGAFDSDQRFLDGIDRDLIPPDNAFTILDLLATLGHKDRLMLDNEAFQYNRISRGRVAKKLVIGDDIQQMIASGSRSAVRQAATVLLELAEGEEPEFVADPAPDGYGIDGLVYHGSRANISVRVRKTGVVKLPQNETYLTEVPSFVWRNYAIVKDGLVNVSTLPVKLSPATEEVLRDATENGLLDVDAVDIDLDTGIALIHLDKMPVINRRMVQDASAAEMVEAEYRLLMAKAAAKVVNYYSDTHLPDSRAAGLADTYGEVTADWLKSIGLTDGGFNPPGEQAESTDVYPAKEFNLKLKGLSTIPPVGKTIEKMAAEKPLTPSETLLEAMIKEIQAFMGAGWDKAGVLANALTGWRKWVRQQTRGAEQALAKQKFTLIVGQGWFSDLAPGEDSITVDVDGQQVTGTIEQRWVDVKI